MAILEEDGVPAETAEKVLTVYAESEGAEGAGIAADGVAPWVDELIEQILSEAESALPEVAVAAVG